MRVPSELSICGQTVKIIYDDECTGEVCGMAEPADNKIYIYPAMHKTEDALLKTLAHEAFHVFLDYTGLSNHMSAETEESIACGIENGYFPLFRFDRRKWRKTLEIQIGG